MKLWLSFSLWNIIFELNCRWDRFYGQCIAYGHGKKKKKNRLCRLGRNAVLQILIHDFVLNISSIDLSHAICPFAVFVYVSSAERIVRMKWDMSSCFMISL